MLRNVVRIEELAGAAYQALYDDPESVSAELRSVAKKLEELARIDPSMSEIAGILQPASIALDEAAHALRHYLSKLEADPGRLEEVESRLAAIEKLKRKYGASVDEVVAFLEDARRQLAAVEHSSERRDALRKEVARLAGEYREASAKLSGVRRDAARQLSKRVEQELASLAMEKIASGAAGDGSGMVGIGRRRGGDFPVAESGRGAEAAG